MIIQGFRVSRHLRVAVGASALLAAVLAGLPPRAAADELDRGFADPPRSARLRAYWWWLNGNVTQAAITRDLEEMKAKGFGGALICDAGGAEQDQNDPVPRGPVFFSREWRELYKHALREADRLGLEMSLNIQSGWNLGGPMVSAEDAAKKLVWSEAVVKGPGKVEQRLPEPERRDRYYRDLFVVAFRLNPVSDREAVLADIRASSAQAEHSARAAVDGSLETYWVSGTDEPGAGPKTSRPEWLQLAFRTPISANRLSLRARAPFGPKECELLAAQDGTNFVRVRSFVMQEDGNLDVSFPDVSARAFRLSILSSFDPRFPKSPRNVQVAELKLSGKDGDWPRGESRRASLQNWQQKAMYQALHSSAPDTAPLFEEYSAATGDEVVASSGVLDLTARLDPRGVLRWEAPAGEWQVLRFGCTIGNHSRVSTCSEGWQGYALDVLDAGAFQRYWDAVVQPLIADAGPLAGKTLKYLHTDSWEVEAVNWTPTLREEFRHRRGYDFLPFLPAMAGRIVDSRPVSNRFLHDLRKTLGDLAIANHYRLFRDNAHRANLEIHPESGGPHAVPIDAQRCLGWNDAPMSEFWAWSWRHRVGDENRFFVKQPASAAHTYGRRLVLAEGFTTIGPHWQETIWDNLKPAFDKALCEGLNLLVWHAFVCSPAEMGMPGQQYFAGTHFNPNTTWWNKSGPFLSYINRSQFLMQQGLFRADVCYYYGDHVPNFAQLKRSDPARILPGYDYDVITEEAILTRAAVKQGRIILPDGMSYRLMVLPNRTIISLPVLEKLRQLVAEGATIIGPKPDEASGLYQREANDAKVRALASEMWGAGDGASLQSHPFGKGRVFSGVAARQVLMADGVQPDFDFAGAQPDTFLDYIHRGTEGAEIYFVANRSNRWEEARCSFRVSGRAPELWNAATGVRGFAPAYEQRDGRTVVPLEFPPCGSWFVVFREPASQPPSVGASNAAKPKVLRELEGSWSVAFDPRWGGPASAVFESLVSWTERLEPGVKFYSGTATYTKSIDLTPPPAKGPVKLWLDLGAVREVAEVRLNGVSLGVLWAPPFQVDISKAAKPGRNTLEVEVVNFWPNRIIGDQALPASSRLTRTNIRKLTKETALMESGLLGPVRLLEASGDAPMVGQLQPEPRLSRR